MAAFLPPSQQQPSLASRLAQSVGKSLAEKFSGTQKAQSLAPLFQQLGLEEQDIDKLISGGLQPKELLDTAKALSAHQGRKKENTQLQTAVNDTFSRLWDLSGQLGYTPFSPRFSGDTEEREEFESNKAVLIGAIRDLFNKGILTNQKLQLILNSLPKHGDTQKQKKGKLKGIARQLGLEIPGTQEKEAEAEEGFVIMETPAGRRKVPRSKALEAQNAGAKLVR